MRKHLGTIFIELTVNDKVSVNTIKLSARKDIFKVLDDLDKRNYGCPFIYFPYEVLDTRSLAAFDIDKKQEFYYFEVVTQCYLNSQFLQALFEFSPKCTFIRTESMSILELYDHLSQTSFRVYNQLAFRRLNLDRPQQLQNARNPLTRMHFYQDVFCLSNLDEQGRFLANVQVNYNRMARRYRKANTGDSDEQRMIQTYLTGTFRRNTQIHLPPKDRDLLFRMMISKISNTSSRRVTEDTQMRDCTVDVMDVELNTSSSEDEEFLVKLMGDLKVKDMIQIERDIKLDLEEHSDFEDEKDRSRQKIRREFY